MNQSQLKPYIIIIIEETHPVNFRSFVNILNKLNLSFVIAPNSDSAIFHAEYTNPDVILIPFNSNQGNPQETYHKLKQAKITQNVPVLWMNSYSQLNLQTLNSFMTGDDAFNPFTKSKDASDYLPTELTIKSLKKQLQIQQELLIQLQAENQQLKRLASLDDLTQVANRRQFYSYLQEQWHYCEEDYLSVILCDVDFFKLYNDTYGHLAGDYCLQKIASALETAVRRVREPEPYLVARYGGEEFAVICPYLDLENARKVAEEIQLQIHSLKIPHRTSTISSYITCSLGVACSIPNDTLHLQELISAADKAMYQAKSQGRDQVYVAKNEV